MRRAFPVLRCLIFPLILPMSASAATFAPAEPPVAAMQPTTFTHHGVTRTDHYAWLRERENPAVRAYLEAENAHTQTAMAPTAALQERIFNELVGRIAEDDQTAPYREGAYWYYSRIAKGENYRTYCRRRAGPGDTLGVEEVYFDAQAAGKDQAYFDLGFLEVSPSGDRLAYAVDLEGDENYRLHFRDLRTGEDLPETVYPVNPWSGEWAGEDFFFYGVDDPGNQRAFALKRHQLGTTAADDVEVMREADEKFSVSLDQSQDGQWLFADISSKETSEVWVLPTAKPTEEFRRLMAREPGVEYGVEHHEGRWIVRTNRGGATEFALLTLPVDHPRWDAAETLVPAREDTRIDGFLVLRDFLVVEERTNGKTHLHTRAWATGETDRIAGGSPAYTLSLATNAVYATSLVRYLYADPVTPSQVIAVDLASGQKTVLKTDAVPSGHNPADYVVKREEATAPDGTQIPITVWHRRDLELTPETPLWLYGYGSYGATIDPGFWRSSYTWADRGFVCAIAHVRGGGFLGEKWYRAGKFLTKRHTFTDFIAAAEHLVAAGYTSPGRIAAEGGSAGGLLMGAIINERPQLWGAVGAHVPFVDVVTTMLDASIPLTTAEYEEWGNPADAAYFHYMLSYSPYDQVSAQAYPPLLVTAGLNDPRVAYWEPAKWVAKLRATATGNAPLFLKTNLDAGPGGASRRYEALRERAFEQAFLLWALGVTE